MEVHERQFVDRSVRLFVGFVVEGLGLVQYHRRNISLNELVEYIEGCDAAARKQAYREFISEQEDHRMIQEDLEGA